MRIRFGRGLDSRIYGNYSYANHTSLCNKERVLIWKNVYLSYVEDLVLLGCYVMLIGKWSQKFRWGVASPRRRSGGNHAPQKCN